MKNDCYLQIFFVEPIFHKLLMLYKSSDQGWDLDEQEDT